MFRERRRAWVGQGPTGVERRVVIRALSLGGPLSQMQRPRPGEGGQTCSGHTHWEDSCLLAPFLLPTLVANSPQPSGISWSVLLCIILYQGKENIRGSLDLLTDIFPTVTSSYR